MDASKLLTNLLSCCRCSQRFDVSFDGDVDESILMPNLNESGPMLTQIVNCLRYVDLAVFQSFIDIHTTPIVVTG